MYRLATCFWVSLRTLSPQGLSIAPKFVRNKTFEFIFRLHHPDWYEKTNGEEVIRYEVRNSGAYHTKCLYLVTAYQTTDIGFRGCLKNIPSSDSYMDFNIKAACRNAIDSTIISPLRKEYEKRIASGEVIVSAISSNQITDIHDLHIDHYDKTFNELGRNRQTLWGGCTDANPKLLLNDT